MVTSDENINIYAWLDDVMFQEKIATKIAAKRENWQCFDNAEVALRVLALDVRNDGTKKLTLTMEVSI